MRSKRVIAGRGVSGAYTLADHREAYAEDFGGEGDSLRLGTHVAWGKNSKRTHT